MIILVPVTKADIESRSHQSLSCSYAACLKIGCTFANHGVRRNAVALTQCIWLP